MGSINKNGLNKNGLSKNGLSKEQAGLLNKYYQKYRSGTLSSQDISYLRSVVGQYYNKYFGKISTIIPVKASELSGKVSDKVSGKRTSADLKKVKKTVLSNKKYNVKSSTSADDAPEASASGILSGGGGGYPMEEAAGKGFSFSDIPSIVWIILAVGAGIFLIKSAKKRK